MSMEGWNKNIYWNTALASLAFSLLISLKIVMNVRFVSILPLQYITYLQVVRDRQLPLSKERTGHINHEINKER